MTPTIYRPESAVRGVKLCRICHNPVCYYESAHHYWPTRPFHHSCYTQMMTEGAERCQSLNTS